MHLSHPPRRDPRLLLLALRDERLAVVVLDAWEILLARDEPIGSIPDLRFNVAHALRTGRPTAVLWVSHAASTRNSCPPWLRVLGQRCGLTVRSLGPGAARRCLSWAPSMRLLRERYPELRGALPAVPARVLRLAAGALVSLSFPSRTYASTRAPSTDTPLADRAASRPRTPPGAQPPADRRTA